MRRDMWLAGLGGAVIGSWLTLVAVQFEFHGWPAVSLSEAGATAPDSQAASSLAGLTTRPAATATPPAADNQVATAAKPSAPEPVSPPAKADGATAETPPPGKPQDEASVTGKSEADTSAPQPATSPAVAPEAATAVTPPQPPIPAPAPAPTSTTAQTGTAPSGSSSADKAQSDNSPTASAKDAAKSNDAAVSSGAGAPAAAPPAEPQATAQADVPPAQRPTTANTATVAVPTPRPDSPEEVAAKNMLQAKLARADAEKPEDGDGKNAVPPTPSPSSSATPEPPAATGGDDTDMADAAKKSARKPDSTTAPDNAGSQPPAAGQPVTDGPAADAQTSDGTAPNAQPQPSQTLPNPSAPAAAPADPSAAPATKTVEIVRPFSDQAGILTVGGRSIQLAGVVPMDTNRNCTDADGKSWPCGITARTALRMFLRGRTIDCEIPATSGEKANVTAACRYAKTDLSDWLVRNGWAEPTPGSPLADANQEARDQKRGIYGSDPRKTGKSTLAPTPPPENPLNPI